jgi:hypothetical protein
MQSKITGGPTSLLFTASILNKYDVKYYRCNQTGFIQTQEPYWLNEAYSSAITKLDVGLTYRNITLSDRVSKILIRDFNPKGVFLDYAGGYGLFTRLMRDKGFYFYHTDQYCQNIFAEYFELNDLPPNTRFELVTAFEVFEHLPQPLLEIKKMLEFTDTLLFSTELQPKKLEKVEDWAYFSTETGQHISFYNEPALQSIADELGYQFYTDSKFLHLFTKVKFNHNPLKTTKDSFLLRKAKKFVNKTERNLGMPESLLMRDWKYIKDKLNS